MFGKTTLLKHKHHISAAPISPCFFLAFRLAQNHQAPIAKVHATQGVTNHLKLFRRQKFHHGSNGTHTKGTLLSRSLLLREISYVNVIHLPPAEKKNYQYRSVWKYQEFHDCRWCYPFLKKKVGAILQVSISIISLGEGKGSTCLLVISWLALPEAQVPWRENLDLPSVKVSVSTPKKRIQNIHKGRATMHRCLLWIMADQPIHPP